MKNPHICMQNQTWSTLTHEVDRSEAPMADLPQVREELLRILPEEQLSHLRVLQAPGPHTRRHGQRLVSVEETHWVSFCCLERSVTFVKGNMSHLRNMIMISLIILSSISYVLASMYQSLVDLKENKNKFSNPLHKKKCSGVLNPSVSHFTYI